jgi:glycosyltransferase 2 family protein
MSEEQLPSAPSRRYAVIGVKIAVSAALLALLFSRIDVNRLWGGARNASLSWLAVALLLYLANVLAGIWRWWLLLDAQDVRVAPRTLLGSMLVALFFNNFLPSNIGGDVIRIRDTAQAAGSKTLATTVVLVDRALGLMGLVFVAASGATIAAGSLHHGPMPIWPVWLWAGFLICAATAAPVLLAPAGVGRLLQPLTVLHPEWIGDRIEKLTTVLARFRDRPTALIMCFCSAVFVQALGVVFYVAVAYALRINIAPWDLAVIVPIAIVVQMMPVSINGFGVREATFSFYFTRVGLPIESALLVSLVATGLTMLFSLSGAAVYISRRQH